MIYKESMMSDFFVEWFKMQLLPALNTPHVMLVFIPSISWMNCASKIDTFSYLYSLIPQI
ncbi:transposase [Streptococcus mitis subsp. carlssonii]|uniref:Transposase n=1 Tax=Streptococcus mitis TaxID=28037 RepID=A0A081QYH1_STRMT|nr:transposase [Streptococcus mitis]